MKSIIISKTERKRSDLSSRRVEEREIYTSLRERKKIVPTELAKKTTARRLAPPSSGKSRLPRPRRPLSRPKMMMPMMIVPPPPSSSSSSRNHHLSRKIPLSRNSSSSQRCCSFCLNFFVGCPRQTARKNLLLLLCSTATSHSAPPLYIDACVSAKRALYE